MIVRKATVLVTDCGMKANTLKNKITRGRATSNLFRIFPVHAAGGLVSLGVTGNYGCSKALICFLK